MTFIESLTKAAGLPAVVVEAQQLYVSSHFCWAAHLGPGGELGASIVGRVKAVCALLEPDIGQPTLHAVAKARGRATKKSSKTVSTVSTAVDVPAGTTDIAQDLTATLQASPGLCSVLCVRLWLLLCRWSQPATVLLDDRKASDGKIGSAVYLTNALCALRESVQVAERDTATTTTTSGSAGQEQWEGYSKMLSCDVQSLYFSLGLFGRRGDQNEAVGLLKRLRLRLTRVQVRAQAPASSGSSSVCLELEALQLLQAVWDGEPCTADLGPSTNSTTTSTHWTQLVSAMVSIAQGALATAMDADPASTAATLCDAADVAWTAVGRTARTTAALGYAGSAPDASMQAVRAWLALLCAKTCSYVHCDRRRSLYWARKALGATAQSSASAADSSSSSSSSSNSSSNSTSTTG